MADLMKAREAAIGLLKELDALGFVELSNSQRAKREIESVLAYRTATLLEAASLLCEGCREKLLNSEKGTTL